MLLLSKCRKQVSLEERMLREPFWLGLIAVFFVMILIGFVIRITVIIMIMIVITINTLLS